MPHLSWVLINFPNTNHHKQQLNVSLSRQLSPGRALLPCGWPWVEAVCFGREQEGHCGGGCWWARPRRARWAAVAISNHPIGICGTRCLCTSIALLIPRVLLTIVPFCKGKRESSQWFLGDNYPFSWLCWLHFTFREPLSHSMCLRHDELSSCHWEDRLSAALGYASGNLLSIGKIIKL